MTAVRMAAARAPEELRRLAADFDVPNNFAFLPHRRAIPQPVGTVPPYAATNMLTFCNCYVAVFTAALGCPVPASKANDQATWLAGVGGTAAGWRKCDAQEAVQRAAAGFPTIAVATVPSPGHGHIAMVMPPPPSDLNGLYVSAAGADCFVYTQMVKSFGQMLMLRAQYFTHD